jgi:hypothetical protein
MYQKGLKIMNQRIPEDVVVVLEADDWTVYYSAFADRFIFYTTSYHPRALGITPEALYRMLGKARGDGRGLIC